MKYVAFPLAAVLVLACAAEAQVNPQTTLLLGSPAPVSAAFAVAIPNPEPAAPLPPAAPAPQGVYGVFQNFNFEAYGGFTYIRFYEAPGITGNLDGFNASIVYYPHSGRLGVDGELAAGFAPQNGVNTDLVLGMGGVRYRFIGNKGVELWVHGLGGGAHFSPQTPYGNKSAFAFEAGGGMDFSPHRGRFGYRFELDAAGTLFFGTYQINPKLSVGVFYKF